MITSAYHLVHRLREPEQYLWTNEGNDFKAWVGGEDAEPIDYVDVAMADELLSEGIIEHIDGDYPWRLFKYRLTNK